MTKDLWDYLSTIFIIYVIAQFAKEKPHREDLKTLSSFFFGFTSKTKAQYHIIFKRERRSLCLLLMWSYP